MHSTDEQVEQVRRQAADEHTFGPAWAMLRSLGVIQDGHYWMRNKVSHVPYYFDTSPLFLTGSILTLIQDFPAAITDPEVRDRTTAVAGPHFSGDTIALLLANLLRGQAKEPRMIHFVPIEVVKVMVGKNLERKEFVIRPYFQDYLRGAKVLLTDNVRVTDGTMKSCAQLIESYGGEVLASASLIDAAIVEHPRTHFSLWKQGMNFVYTPGPGCPMCRQGLPMTKF